MTIVKPSQPQFHRRPPSLPAWWWLVPLLLVTTWLGARALDADAIWNDEFYSIHSAGGPPYGPISPAAIWERVATSDPWHTPGYFILLSGWGDVVGWQPPALRALSLFAGLLGIAWTYRLGRELAGPRAALYAAALLSTSAFFVYYLHEIRMYTAFVPLTAFVIWAYMRIARGARSQWYYWLGLFAGTLGMLYIHYFAALPLAALGLYHLFIMPKNRRWWGVIGVLALAGLLYLPWLSVLTTGLQLAAASEELHMRALTPAQATERLVTLFGNGMTLLTLGGLLLGGLSLFRRVRGARLAWFLMLATVATVLLTNAVLALMHEGRVRYMISAWPLVALVVGLGVAQLRRLPRPFGVLTTAAFVGVWWVLGIAQSMDPAFAASFDGAARTFPVHRVARALREVVGPDDVLVSYLPDGSRFWVYERNQEITQFYFNGVPLGYTTAHTTLDLAEQAALEQVVLDAIGDSQRLWLAYQPGREAAAMPGLMSTVEARYDLCRTPIEESDLRIALYTQLPMCCDDATPRGPLVSYDAGTGQIALSGLGPLPDVAGDRLEVVMAWTVDGDVPADTYSVALHVVDERGELAAQGDAGLPDVAFSCQGTTIDLTDVAPGAYTLDVIVYRWQDGVRLVGRDADSGETGERLALGRFERVSEAAS